MSFNFFLKIVLLTCITSTVIIVNNKDKSNQIKQRDEVSERLIANSVKFKNTTSRNPSSINSKNININNDPTKPLESRKKNIQKKFLYERDYDQKINNSSNISLDKVKLTKNRTWYDESLILQDIINNKNEIKLLSSVNKSTLKKINFASRIHKNKKISKTNKSRKTKAVKSSFFATATKKVDSNQKQDIIQKTKVEIYNVQLHPTKLEVTGQNLATVKEIRIKDSSNNDHKLNIKLMNMNSIIAIPSSGINLIAKKFINIIISTASGSTIYPITITLEDGQVTSSKLASNSITTDKISDNAITSSKIADNQIDTIKISPSGASQGQVLKFDGGNWIPGDLDSISFKGTWDASKDIAPGSQNVGNFYIVNVAGTTDLAGKTGTNSWEIGDWAIYSEEGWEKIKNTNSVTSVFGRTGNIQASLSDLTDVNAIASSNDDVLKFDGGKWIPSQVKDIEKDPVFESHSSSSITNDNISNWNQVYTWGNHSTQGYLKNFLETDPLFSAHPSKDINAVQITSWKDAHSWGDHSIEGYIKSFTELDPQVMGFAKSSVADCLPNYVLTMSSGKLICIQDFHLNINGAASSITTNNLDTNKVVISGPSGKVQASPITNEELGYLAGLTSSIKDSLDSKLNSSEYSSNSLKASNDSPTSAVFVDPDGNTGIGTESPTEKFEVNNGDIKISNDSDAGLVIKTRGNKNSYIDFYQKNTLKGDIYWANDRNFFAINSSGTRTVINPFGGNLGVSKSNPTHRLDIAGGNGRVQSGYSWLTNSDIRYKKNISTIKNTLSKITKIRAVRYNLKENKSTLSIAKGKHIGVIAQELEKEFPELVIAESGSGYKSVAYDKLGPIAIQAIKELKIEKDNELKLLKIENMNIKKQLKNITKRINNLLINIKHTN